MYGNSHTDFFQIRANIYVQKLWERYLQRFWPSYPTEVLLEFFMLLEFLTFDENFIFMSFN